MKQLSLKVSMNYYSIKNSIIKLSKDKYIVLNDIMLKTNVSTHRIDHIVISKFGIYVIEKFYE